MLSRLVKIISLLLITILVNAEIRSATDVVIASRPFAVQSWILRLSSVTTINIAETYELLCGTSALIDGAWFHLAIDENGNPNKLTCAKAHKYGISFSGCLRDETADSSTIKVILYLNGVQYKYEKSQYYPVQDKLEGIDFVNVIDMEIGDYLEVRVTTDDGSEVNCCTATLRLIPFN